LVQGRRRRVAGNSSAPHTSFSQIAMALRAAALIAVSSAAGASAASACPGSENPMMSVVTDLSPECFKQCPQMCQPLDGLVAEYLATSDTNAVKAKVCAEQEPFTCMFEASHLEDCGKVLAAGSALGVQLPMSAAELKDQCSLSSLRGGGAKHMDMPAPGDSNSTNVTDGGKNQTRSDDISAAGGRGVAGTAAALLLGLMGPAALLFTA